MNKLFNLCTLLAVIALQMGMVACSDDDTELPKDHLLGIERPMYIPIIAEGLTDTEGTETEWEWNEDDAIAIFSADGSRLESFKLYRGAGTSKGIFTGNTLPDGEYNVMYNVSLFHTVGSVQTYNPGRTTPAAPMIGRLTIKNGIFSEVKLSNTCGLLRVNLRGTGIVYKVNIRANEIIAGSCELDNDMTYHLGGNIRFNSIDLKCEHGAPLLSYKDTPYYFIIPQGDYSGLKIEVSDFCGNVSSHTLEDGGNISIKRSQITTTGFTTQGLKYNNVSLNWDTPVGAIGMLRGREAMVVDLGGNIGKRAVALSNEGASSPDKAGSFVDWYQAYDMQTDGWRLPSVDEILALHNLDNNSDDNIKLIHVAENSDLVMPITEHKGRQDNKVVTYTTRKAIRQWNSAIYYNVNQVAFGFYRSFDNIASLTTYEVSSHNDNGPFNYVPLHNVRLIHTLPMTQRTPVGRIGMIGNTEAVVAIMNQKKVAITLYNVGANSQTTYFKDDKKNKTYYDCYGTKLTYNEALAACTNGWYIPSYVELSSLKFDYDEISLSIPPESEYTGEYYVSGINANIEETKLTFHMIGSVENLEYNGSTHITNPNEYVYWTSQNANKQYNCFVLMRVYAALVKNNYLCSGEAKFYARLCHPIP